MVSKRRGTSSGIVRIKIGSVVCWVGFLGFVIYLLWVCRMSYRLHDGLHNDLHNDLHKNDGNPSSSVATPSLGNKDKTAEQQHNSTGMSACLLVMDDNHFLIEWLGFHYHTLPLRYLVIAVDPRSKTSPQVILNRWKSMDLTTVSWSDQDYMTDIEREEAETHVSNYFGKHIGPDLIRHRARQRLFYYKCMMHLKERDRDWTVLIDSDEFLYINYPTVEKLHPPPMEQHGSVRSFLNKEVRRPGSNLTSPCVQIPRIRFGGMESNIGETQNRVPKPFQSADKFEFLTMKWRKHAHPDDYGNNRISKVMIDLSRVPWEDLKPVDSIHRPIRSMCGKRKLHIRKSQQAVVINHYLGSLEQYLFRDDSRVGNERSVQQYNKAKRVQSETDDAVRPWLEGFVKDEGVTTASHLLGGAGLVGDNEKSI